MKKILNSPALIAVAYAFFIWITVILMIGKLIGVIGIGWVWVFAPLWIPSALVTICVLTGVLLLLKDEKKYSEQDRLLRNKYQGDY